MSKDNVNRVILTNFNIPQKNHLYTEFNTLITIYNVHILKTDLIWKFMCSFSNSEFQ